MIAKLSFNPCFNGSMYKNEMQESHSGRGTEVSILVLMDLCIKTFVVAVKEFDIETSFNPCFNGSMYKN